MTKYKDAGW